jgi:hypothetical protein
LDGEVDQLGGGLFVGEVAAGLDRLADLAVEVLDAVGGVDGAAQVLGQREKRRDQRPVRAPEVGDHRVTLAPALVEDRQRGLGGVGVDRAVDGLEIARDGLAVAVGDVAHRAADLMHDAGLHPGGREDGLDRLREAGQAVDAGDQHVGDAALVQIV